MSRNPPAAGVRVVFGAAAVALSLARHVVGQIDSNTTCIPSLQPLFNTKGQSPCIVAAFLGSLCFNGDFSVGPIPSGDNYDIPSSSNGIVNQCECSTVTYSLLSACALCQNGTVVSWTDWITNCPKNITTVASFPLAFGPDVAVPGWAYENVTTKNTFDLNVALADDSPDSTAASSFPSSTSASVSTVYTTISNGAGPTSSAPSSSPTSSTSSGSSDKGAIAGGVVGGIIGVALLGLLGIYLRRRFIQRRASSSIDMPLRTGHSTGSTVVGQSMPLMSETDYSGRNDKVASSRLYDPDDPSTFPAEPYASQFSSHEYDPYNRQSSGQLGSYRGVAEV